jgi:hypothetical protein
VKIVDTTCPWVSKVWNAVDAHTRKDMTSVIHGKWAHEESIATASFAETYLIVKDIHEAEYVANYVLNGGDKAEFMRKFKNAMSPGFDPDRDLEKVRSTASLSDPRPTTDTDCSPLLAHEPPAFAVHCRPPCALTCCWCSWPRGVSTCGCGCRVLGPRRWASRTRRPCTSRRRRRSRSSSSAP